VRWFVKDNVALSVEARYIHLSCAGIYSPNLGPNSWPECWASVGFSKNQNESSRRKSSGIRNSIAGIFKCRATANSRSLAKKCSVQQF
jgi:hypothetical protein